MSKLTFENSLEAGIHKDLHAFTGEWEGVTRTWFEPGVLADESPMKGKITTVLGGRFILYEYHGSLSGKPFEGIAFFGYSISHMKFQSAWIDSFHMGTAVMFSTGEHAAGKVAVTGNYGTGVENEEPWGWRTEMEMVGDQLMVTAYNISPSGEEAKAVETVYGRIA